MMHPFPTPLLHGCRLLVADGDEPVTDLLADVLGADGGEVIARQSVTDTIEAIRRYRVSLVLLGLQLRDGEGWDVLQAIRQRDPMLIQRIILLSSQRYCSRTRRRIQASQLPVLYKPFSLDDLRHATRQVMAGLALREPLTAA